VKKPIFHLKKKRLRSSMSRKSGFTLVEIMLVIVLLSLLATAVVPRITNVFRVSVQSSVRRFGALVKYAFDQAILTNRIHRIVLDMEKQEWSLEAAPPGAVAGLDFVERDADIKVDPNRVLKQPEFKKIKGSLVDRMPPGVQIYSVESGKKNRKKSEDSQSKVHYVFAYPGGFIDKTIVSLAETGKKNSQTFRITIQSLTGKVKVEVDNDGVPGP
jgi:prepilin-type N-terminal cleavage/methylation domain-containing protein